jgi:hypothetical protein
MFGYTRELFLTIFFQLVSKLALLSRPYAFVRARCLSLSTVPATWKCIALGDLDACIMHRVANMHLWWSTSFRRRHEWFLHSHSHARGRPPSACWCRFHSGMTYEPWMESLEPAGRACRKDKDVLLGSPLLSSPVTNGTLLQSAKLHQSELEKSPLTNGDSEWGALAKSQSIRGGFPLSGSASLPTSSLCCF